MLGPEDLEFLCRICLENIFIKQVNSTFLNETLSVLSRNSCGSEDVKLSEIISYSVGIQMPIYYGASNSICDICLVNIRTCYSLKRQCEIAQRKFINCPVLEDDPLHILPKLEREIEDLLDEKDATPTHHIQINNRMFQAPIDKNVPVTETTTQNKTPSSSRLIKRKILLTKDEYEKFLLDKSAPIILNKTLGLGLLKLPTQETSMTNINNKSSKENLVQEKEANDKSSKENSVQETETTSMVKVKEIQGLITRISNKPIKQMSKAKIKEKMLAEVTDLKSIIKKTFISKIKSDELKSSIPDYKSKQEADRTNNEQNQGNEDIEKATDQTHNEKSNERAQQGNEDIDLKKGETEQKTMVCLVTDNKNIAFAKRKTKDECDNESFFKNIRKPKRKIFSLCEFCGKIVSGLNTHVSKHLVARQDKAQRERKCEICAKVLTNKYRLTNHIKSVHVKSLMCHICGKKVGLHGHLQVHMRQHTGEHPYKCTLCPASFKQRVLLRRHMSHTHNATI